jgi:hypothetical protein
MADTSNSMADSGGMSTATFTNRNGRRDRSGRQDDANDPGPSNGQTAGGEQNDVLHTDREGGTAAYEHCEPQGEAVTRGLPAERQTNPLGTRGRRR